ncbi:hypothetical protein CSUI_010804, partial [Cystoisospora suis]
MRKAAAAWASSPPLPFTSSLTSLSPFFTIQYPEPSSVRRSPLSSPVSTASACGGSASSSAGSFAPQSSPPTCSIPHTAAGGSGSDAGAHGNDSASVNLQEGCVFPPRSVPGAQRAKRHTPTALPADPADSQNRLEELKQFQLQRGPSRHFRCDLCTKQRCPGCSLEQPQPRQKITTRDGRPDTAGPTPAAEADSALDFPLRDSERPAKSFTLGSPRSSSSCPSATRSADSPTTPLPLVAPFPLSTTSSSSGTFPPPEKTTTSDTLVPALEAKTFSDALPQSGSAAPSPPQAAPRLSSESQNAGESPRVERDLGTYCASSPPPGANESAGGDHAGVERRGRRAAEDEDSRSGSVYPCNSTVTHPSGLHPGAEGVLSSSFCTTKQCCSLLTCDFCTRGFHLACLGLPLSFAPPDDQEWLCGVCLERAEQVLKARGLWTHPGKDRAVQAVQEARAAPETSTRKGGEGADASKKTEIRTLRRGPERLRGNEQDVARRGELSSYHEEQTEARTENVLDKQEQGRNEKEDFWMPDEPSEHDVWRLERMGHGATVNGGHYGDTRKTELSEVVVHNVSGTRPALSYPGLVASVQENHRMYSPGVCQPEQNIEESDEEESPEEAEDVDEWLVQVMTPHLTPAAMRQQLTSASPRGTCPPRYPKGLTTALFMNPDTGSVFLPPFHKESTSGKEAGRESKTAVSSFSSNAPSSPFTTSESSSATSSCCVSSSTLTGSRARSCVPTSGGGLSPAAPHDPSLLMPQSREVPPAAPVLPASLLCLPSCSVPSGDSLGAPVSKAISAFSACLPPGECDVSCTPTFHSSQVSMTDGLPNELQCTNLSGTMTASCSLDVSSLKPPVRAGATLGPRVTSLPSARLTQENFPDELGFPPAAAVSSRPASSTITQRRQLAEGPLLAGVSSSLTPCLAIESSPCSPGAMPSRPLPAASRNPPPPFCSTAQPLSCLTGFQPDRADAEDAPASSQPQPRSDGRSSLRESVQSLSLQLGEARQNVTLTRPPPRGSDSLHLDATNEKESCLSPCAENGGCVSEPMANTAKELTGVSLSGSNAFSPESTALENTDKRDGEGHEVEQHSKGTSGERWKDTHDGETQGTSSRTVQRLNSTTEPSGESSKDTRAGVPTRDRMQGQAPLNDEAKSNGPLRQTVTVTKEQEQLQGGGGHGNRAREPRGEEFDSQTSARGPPQSPGVLSQPTDEREERRVFTEADHETKELEGDIQLKRNTTSRSPERVEKEAKTLATTNSDSLEAYEAREITAEQKPFATSRPQEDGGHSCAQARTSELSEDPVPKKKEEEELHAAAKTVVSSGECKEKEISAELPTHAAQELGAEETYSRKQPAAEAEELPSAVIVRLAAEARNIGDANDAPMKTTVELREMTGTPAKESPDFKEEFTTEGRDQTPTEETRLSGEGREARRESGPRGVLPTQGLPPSFGRQTGSSSHLPSAISSELSSCSPFAGPVPLVQPAAISSACSIPPSLPLCSSFIVSSTDGSNCLSPSVLGRALSFLQPCASCFLRLFPLGRPLSDISVHCRIQRQHILQPNVKRDVLSAHLPGPSFSATTSDLETNSAARGVTDNRLGGWCRVHCVEEEGRFRAPADGSEALITLAQAAAAAAGTADWLLSEDEACLDAGDATVPLKVGSMASDPVSSIVPSHFSRLGFPSFSCYSQRCLLETQRLRRPHSCTVLLPSLSSATLVSMHEKQQVSQEDTGKLEGLAKLATEKLEELSYFQSFLRPGEEVYFRLANSDEETLQETKAARSSFHKVQRKPTNCEWDSALEGANHPVEVGSREGEDQNATAPVVQSMCSVPTVREISLSCEEASQAGELSLSCVADPGKSGAATSVSLQDQSEGAYKEPEVPTAMNNVSAPLQASQTGCIQDLASVFADSETHSKQEWLPAQSCRLCSPEEIRYGTAEGEVAVAVEQERRMRRRRRQQAETLRISKSVRLLFRAFEEVEQENSQILETLSKWRAWPNRGRLHPDTKIEAEMLADTGAEMSRNWRQDPKRQPLPRVPGFKTSVPSPGSQSPPPQGVAPFKEVSASTTASDSSFNPSCASSPLASSSASIPQTNTPSSHPCSWRSSIRPHAGPTAAKQGLGASSAPAHLSHPRDAQEGRQEASHRTSSRDSEKSRSHSSVSSFSTSSSSSSSASSRSSSSSPSASPHSRERSSEERQKHASSFAAQARRIQKLLALPNNEQDMYSRFNEGYFPSLPDKADPRRRTLRPRSRGQQGPSSGKRPRARRPPVGTRQTQSGAYSGAKVGVSREAEKRSKTPYRLDKSHNSAGPYI